MGKNIYLSLATGLLLLLLSESAFAFKVEGHEALELIAYEELLKAETLREGEETFRGCEVIVGLKDANILLTKPNGRLRIGSGGPDVALERQFDTRNQGFHFMAENGDVLAAAEEPDPPRALLELSYHKNLSLMRLLFDETVENPDGAFQAGRGFYVLLHMVGDSFSTEHVKRDNLNRIMTIKGWELIGVNWPQAATQTSGLANDGTELLSLLHRAFGAAGDDDWHEPGDERQLTREGRRAVEAMKSLMKILYVARKEYDERGAACHAQRDRLWAEFVENHFNNHYCPMSNGKWTCDNRNALAVSLEKRIKLIDADAFPSFQFTLAPGWRFSSGEKTIPFVQIIGERHFVPYRATGFITRVRPDIAVVSLRVPVTSLDIIEERDRHWYTGIEGSVQAGGSTMLPFLQWVGVNVGPAIRAGQSFEVGPAATLTWNIYARRYYGFTIRWEHNWLWSQNGYEGHSSNLGIGASFFLVHAREVKGFKYPQKDNDQ